MQGKYIHDSKFGYFYTYCLNNSNPKIKREISKLQKIVNITNNLDAINNNVYNKKISRQEMKMEILLKKIAKKNPDFLFNFVKEYSDEVDMIKTESDPQIIARNLSQSFFEIYQIKMPRKNNIVIQKNKYQIKEKDIIINLTEKEKEKLKTQDKNNNEFPTFLIELKKCKCHRINRYLNNLIKINDIEIKENETKEEYEKRVNHLLKKAFNNIDMIFEKGTSYPFRKDFIKVLSILIFLYDIKIRKLSELKKYLKKSLKMELLNKYIYNGNYERKPNHGYEIPNDTSSEELIKIQDELEREKYYLIEKHHHGEDVKLDRLFCNNIQSKKIDMINSYFNPIYDYDITIYSSDQEIISIILDLCDLADEITEDLFKKVIFDAHDSSNLIVVQSYEKNELLRTLYNLYSPLEKLDKYDKIKNKLENILNQLNTSKRDFIYKMAQIEKQKRHMSTKELVPNIETIMINLAIRETKFIESHAVEEFKHKAMNQGKYLNYDLEIVARDIETIELPALYQKLKRNITYTNFVEEIKPGEDREKKYKEARMIQRKTLSIAQEMIAKTIINNSYDHEFDISYDNYQAILNDIYENILHEERLTTNYDEVYDETEVLERNYQEKKKKWDEYSIFVKALYLVVSKKDNS